MSNILEYTLKLNDQMSSTLSKVGASSENTTRKVNTLTRSVNKIHFPVNGVSQFGNTSNAVLMKATGQTSKLVNNTNKLTQSYHHLVPPIKKVERSIDQLDRRSQLAGRNTLSSISSIIKKAGMIAGVGLLLSSATSVVSSASRFVGDSITQGLDRQQVQTSFNVLAGNETAGKKLTNQLIDLQKNTILGSEVFKNAQTMLGFGFDSSEVYDNLKMLGDVSMGDTQRLESLTLAFSQIRAAGKLAGQDLLQLVNAGFNPLDTISKKTGISIVKLKDDMSKGLITFDMVKKAFKDATSEGGRFENMLAKIAATPVGKLQQIKGEWQEIKIQIGAAFMPLVSIALQLAQKFLQIIDGFIKPLTSGIERIANLIKGVTGEINNWSYYGSQFREIFSVIFVTASDMWTIFTQITAELTTFIGKSEIIKDVFNGIVQNWKIGFLVLNTTMRQMMFFIENVLLPPLLLAESLYRTIKGGKTAKYTPKNSDYINVVLPSKIPGLDAPSTGGSGDKPGGNAGKDTANSIATGGSKTTHIYLTVSEMGNNMNIYVNDVKEGAEDIRDIVLDQLTRALVLAQGQI